MTRFKIKPRETTVELPVGVAKNIYDTGYGQYRDLIDTATSPKTGLDHPTLSIDDIIQAHNYKYRITGITLQRTNKITEEEAILSGVEIVGSTDGLFETQQALYKNYNRKGYGCWSALSSLETLFDSIHGTDAFSAKPWVWVFDLTAIK